MMSDFRGGSKMNPKNRTSFMYDPLSISYAEWAELTIKMYVNS